PADVPVGRGARIEVIGRDAAGGSHSLVGSSELTLSVEPATAALIDGPFVIGRSPGNAQLVASIGNLKQSREFTITSESGPAIPFAVKPAQAEMLVGELLTVDVASASKAEVSAESTDSSVVEAVGPRTLSAHAPGQAEVKFTQGTQSQSVKV